MDEARLFVAAIDFGTTYSGFAFSAKNDSSIYTCDWKNGDLTSQKTPTSVLLDKHQKFAAFGYDADNKYLRSIVPDDQIENYYYFRRFKMMLHTEKVTLDTKIKDECTGKCMKAIDIFCIAINYLREQVIKNLKKRILSSKEEDVQYVLTVPAIWADQAKLFMRKAAEQAKIPKDQLTLALEPEAASIYCQNLKTDRDTKANTFVGTIKQGMKYMVIDLGGGTADITVHQRQSDDTLEEIIPASGGPWGGTTIDDAYLEFLKTLFSPEVMDGLKENDLEDYFDFLKEFEVKKRSIKAETETDIVITMNVGLMELIKELKGGINTQIQTTKFKDVVSVDGQKLHIKPETFRNLFHPTIKNLLDHLEQLFKDPKLSNLKTIIMVGGFSECELVQLAVKNKFGKKKTIIIPDEAGLAVLKGAVLFGHQRKTIAKRILKKTYGIQSWPEFDPDIHPVTKRVTIDGVDRCKDVFFKFATKDDLVEDGHSHSHIFEALKPDEKMLECAVFTSTDHNPRYVTDPSCQRLGNLVIDLPNVRSGEKVEIEETMVFGGTELLFRAKNLRTGMICESVFDF